jgi:hypothetical protein
MEDRILQDSDGCKEIGTMKQSKIDGNLSSEDSRYYLTGQTSTKLWLQPELLQAIV